YASKKESVPDLYNTKGNQEAQDAFLDEFSAYAKENDNWSLKWGYTDPEDAVDMVRKAIKDADEESLYTVPDPSNPKRNLKVVVPPAVMKKALSYSVNGEKGDEDWDEETFKAQLDLAMKDYIVNNKDVLSNLTKQEQLELR